MDYLKRDEAAAAVIGPAEKQRTFVTLDGLRGIAAIAVITRHVRYFDYPFFESYLAVDFFFVLSGFVLSYAYGNRLRSGLSPLDFIKIRLVRLYPLYFLSLIATVVVLGYGVLSAKHKDAGLTVPGIFFSTLFLPTPATLWSAGLFPLNRTAWSLFFELIANAWWAIAWRRIRDLHLAIFVGAAALIMTVAVLSKSAGFGFATNTGIMDNGSQWGSICAGFFRVGYSFFSGVLLHRLWSKKNIPLRVSPWLPFFLLLIVLTAHPSAAYQSVYDLCSALFVFPLIVWLGASSPASGQIATGFSLLGIASYGIYILQGAALDIFSHFARGIDHALPPAIVGVIFILLLFGSTLAADKYFDRPVRDWLMLKFRRGV